MISLDTNLLARLLLGDDKRQHSSVVQLLAGTQDFTAPVTAMLELVRVLEANGLATSDIVRGLNLLLGLPNFKPQQADSIRQALAAYAHGIDFADALHLALSHGSQQLATFDKAFARKAAKLGLLPPVVAI